MRRILNNPLIKLYKIILTQPKYPFLHLFKTDIKKYDHYIKLNETGNTLYLSNYIIFMQFPN